MIDVQDGGAHEERAFPIANKHEKMQSSAQSNGYGSSSQQQTAMQVRDVEMGVESSSMKEGLASKL